MLEQLVKVSILDLRWFFSKKQNFVAVSKLLKKHPNRFYETKFVKLIIDRFWN